MGSKHNACTVDGHPEGLAWCSTKTEGGYHVEGGGHWGLCAPSCPQETSCPIGWTHLPTGCYLLDTQVIWVQSLHLDPPRCAIWRRPRTSARPWRLGRELLPMNRRHQLYLKTRRG